MNMRVLLANMYVQVAAPRPQQRDQDADGDGVTGMEGAHRQYSSHAAQKCCQQASGWLASTRRDHTMHRANSLMVFPILFLRMERGNEQGFSIGYREIQSR